MRPGPSMFQQRIRLFRRRRRERQGHGSDRHRGARNRGLAAARPRAATKARGLRHVPLPRRDRGEGTVAGGQGERLEPALPRRRQTAAR